MTALLGTAVGAVVRRMRAEPLVVAVAAVSLLLAATFAAAIPIYSEAVALAGLERRLDDAPRGASTIEIALVPGDDDTRDALDARVRDAVADVLAPIGADVALETERERLVWRASPHFERLTGADLRGLRARLETLEERLNEDRPAGDSFAVYTSLGSELEEARASLRIARAGVLVASAQVAILAFYALLFTAGLVVERRERASETLRLRGASTRQLFLFAVLEGAILAVPTAFAGPWLAVAAISLLDRVGPLGAAGLALDPRVSAAATALAAVAAGVSALALSLPVLRARRVSVAGERERRSASPLLQRGRLDLALVAVAVVAYWQLRRYRDPFVGEDGLGLDPFLVLAPAVCLLAGAVIVLRLVPLVARAVEAATRHARGVVVSLGPRELARRPSRWMRAALLLALSIAIGVFSAVYGESWRAAQGDRAAREAGSDVRVVPSRRTGALPAEYLGSAYRALPQVEAALPVARDALDLERTAGEVIALDAGAAARLDVLADRVARHLRELERTSEPPRAVPLAGAPESLALAAEVEVLAVETFGPPDIPREALVDELQLQLSLFVADRDDTVRELALGRLTTGEAPVGARLAASGRRPAYPLALAGLRISFRSLVRADLLLRVTLRGLPIERSAWRAVASPLPDARTEPEAVAATGGDAAVSVRFRTGSLATAIFGSRPIDVLAFPAGGPAARIDALASDELLRRTGTAAGDVLELSLAGTTRRVRVIGDFESFPGVAEGVPALVVDLGTLAALRLADAGGTRPTEWWLETADGAEAVAARLRAPPYTSAEVVSRAELRRTLLTDPIALGHLGALLLGLLAAAGFAVVGFGLNTFAALRGRLGEIAVLRALGLGRHGLARTLAVELLLLVLPTLAAGIVLGLATSWLVLPFLALGGRDAGPATSVAVPWPTLLALGTVVALALVGVLVVALRNALRLDVAGVLRSGDAA